MKKKIWSILLSLLFIVTSFVPVHGQASYVSDEAGYFGFDHKTKYENLAQRFYEDYKLNVVVVFCKEGDLIENANQYYQNNFGDSDGFVIGIKKYGDEKYLNAYGGATQYLEEPLNLDDIFSQYQLTDAIQEIIYQLSLKVAPTEHSRYVVDKANLLTPKQEKELDATIQEIITAYENDVVILTSYFKNNKDSGAYLDDYYDSYLNGYKEDGLILGMDMTDRYWYISTSGHSIWTFTDWGIKYLGQEMLPYFKINDYYGGFEIFLNYVDKFFEKDANGSPYDIENNEELPDYEDVDRELYPNSKSNSSSSISSSKNIPKAFIIALGIGLLVGLIINTGKLNQLKTKKAIYEANNYVKEDSFNLTASTDLYLYKTLTKTPRPHDDDRPTKTSHSSSKSITRPSGGSTTHTSSSGRSHGGGGGHFLMIDILNSNVIPTIAQLGEYVNNELWNDFCNYLINEYKIKPHLDYSKCSWQPGWNVKFKKAGKNLCTLYSQEG